MACLPFQSVPFRSFESSHPSFPLQTSYDPLLVVSPLKGPGLVWGIDMRFELGIKYPIFMVAHAC